MTSPPAGCGDASWRRRTSARLRDRVLAGDPAGFSALAALRALLCLVAAGGSLLALGEQVQSALLASVLAMVTSVAIVEAGRAAQAATMALGFAAALGTVCLATLVTRSALAGGAVLCALVFVVVLARALGPRGVAVGMLAFMGYFFANFIAARPGQIPGLALAIAASAAVAFLVRFVAVPDRPGRTQRRVLRAFAARTRVLLDDLGAELASDANSRRRRRIRRDTGRLNEIALALEDSVGGRPKDGSEPPPPAVARRWLLDLLRAELGSELLADAVHRIAENEWSQAARRELSAVIGRLRQWVDADDPRERSELEARLLLARIWVDSDIGDANARARLARRTAVWSRVDRAVALLLAARPWDAVPAGASAAVNVSPMAFRPGGGGTAGLVGVRPNLRLAVQTTIAVALATAAGRELSSTRWYWAAIAAFTVYARAATAAETLSRAWQRMLGTAAGVVVAMALAELLRRHAGPSILVAVVAAAAAYGLLRVSYAGMVLFLTIALGLLYELLGRPVPGMMVLRLGESAIGAIIGVVVASLVLPMHSTERLRRLVAEVLRRSARVMEYATRPGLDPATDAGFFDAVRCVDRALAEVRNAVRPLWAPDLPVEPSRLVTPGRLSAGLAYTIRRFVVDLRPGTLDPDRLRRLGARIAEQCDAAADALDGNRRPVFTSIAGDIAALAAGPAAPDETERAFTIQILQDLDEILQRLSRSAGPLTSGHGP